MSLEVLILAVAVGLLEGKSLEGFKKLKIKELPIIIILFIFDFACYFAALKLSGDIGATAYKYYPYVNIFVMFSLVVICIINYEKRSFILIAAGIAMNLLAMAAYRGYMPVSPQALLYNGENEVLKLIESGKYLTHTVMKEGNPLNFLGDIIPFSKYAPLKKVISYGDIVMSTGIFSLVLNQMSFKGRKRK